jgi:hypothetical protein
VLVNRDGELDFLNDDDLLLFARGPFALVLLVQEFAVILNPANGWVRIRGNFDQVQPALARDFQGLVRCEDPKLLSGFVNDANFARANALVGADEVFRRPLIDVLPPLGLDSVPFGEYTIRTF